MDKDRERQARRMLQQNGYYPTTEGLRVMQSPQEQETAQATLIEAIPYLKPGDLLALAVLADNLVVKSGPGLHPAAVGAIGGGTMGVVHFGDLDVMIGELLDGHTVRVAVLDVTEGVSKDYGIRQAGIGVHVRAFAGEGHVLACYVPVARLQMLGGTVLSGPGGDKGAYSTAWEKAKAEADRMREYLTGQGFDVRPGVIEIGDARPLAGGWSGDTTGAGIKTLD